MKKSDIIHSILLVLSIVLSAITIANNGADVWDWIIIVNSGVILSFVLYKLMKR